MVFSPISFDVFVGGGRVIPYPRGSDTLAYIVRQLLLFIVRGMHCLSIVDDVHFNAFVSAIDPRVKLPSRSTITHNFLPKMYKEAADKLTQELSLVEWVSLTTDAWTCRNNRHYLTVTVHFINSSMALVSRVLATEHLEESTTSENLAARLKGIADVWKIVDKVVGAVTDNAYNIVRAVEIVKETHREWRHIPCFAHTLNLVVKGSIERNHELSSILARSRAIVTFFHQSAKATSKLASLCKNRTSKVLAQDVVTRWNSTLTMIASLVELKEYVQDSLSSPAIDRSDLDLQVHEWETLVSAMELLQPFDEITADLSSQHYPSISKVIPSIRLVMHFLNRRKEDISCLAQLNLDLLSLLSTRFSITLKYSTPHLIATYLDPRFKKLTLHFPKDVSDEAERRTKVQIDFTTKKIIPPVEVPVPTISKTTKNSIWNDHDYAMTVSNANRKGQGPSNEANKIICIAEYNDLPLLPRSADPLEFWKSKRDRGELLPLSKVAVKFQCIPATSVPSEQLFSSASELISESRNRLHPDNVNMLLFLNKNA